MFLSGNEIRMVPGDYTLNQISLQLEALENTMSYGSSSCTTGSMIALSTCDEQAT